METKHIEIPLAKLKAIKADFVKSEITVSVTLRLTDEALALREDLSFIAFMEQPVRVSIDTIQREMDFRAAFTKAAEDITGVTIPKEQDH